MNSMIRVSRLAALTLCGAAVVACDSVKDVRESPTYEIPTDKVALTGEITGVGVGTTRPMEVRIVVTNDIPYELDEDDEEDDGNVVAPDGTRTTFYSLRGVRALSFGAVDIGASYEISVTRQPFGRICTPVSGASGTVTGPVTNIQIECNRDATPLYEVTAAIDPSIANALPQGFAVSLTTEEGVEVIEPEAGETSVTFELPVFYPAANPPAFAYDVRATTTENGTTNNCAVTNGSGSLGTGTGNITNVTVTSCQFTVSAVASYNAPPGGTPQVMGMGGLTLGLKDRSGEIVAETTPIGAFSATPVAFAGTWRSNASALYEVTVTSQPNGQFCAPDNGGLASLVSGGNVTVPVRCRNVPVEANRLTGTYQVIRSADELDDEDPRPLATSAVRNFMTFFANGTFLYGVHHSVNDVGVEHGFYDYNPAAQTVAFSIFTDSSAGVAPFVCRFTFATGVNTCPTALVFGAVNTIGAGPNNGLSGLSGYSVPVVFGPGFAYGDYGPPTIPLVVTATGVTKTAAIPAAPPPSGQPGDPELPAVGPQLSLTFGAGATAATWTLVEPSNTMGTESEIDNMQGNWVTADSKRVWIYDKSSLYGWHGGVNGAPNLQDVCFGVEKRPTPLGYDTLYARRVGSSDIFGGAVGCAPGGIAVVNVPLTSGTSTTVPVVPGFTGAIPGASLNATVSPSPTFFRVTPGVGGAPDTLTVQATLNDAPVGEPVVFTRHSAN